MYLRTHLCYANSHIMSLIQYGLPLYINESIEVKTKIHKCIMKVGRWVNGSYCYRKSCKDILSKLNWKIPEEEIEDSAARFFQKIAYNKEPSEIHDLIRLPRTRINAEITMQKIAKTKPFTKLMLNSMAEMLNRIPDETKREKPHIFKKKLKTMRLLPRKAS